MPKLRYDHDWKTIKEHTVLNEHQKSVGLGNVQDAIEKFMGAEAYAGINKLNQKNHHSVLHSSRGSKLLASGRNVLEIDVAGSGYESFCALHKNLDGLGNIQENGIAVSYDAIRRKELKKPSFWNKIGFLQKLPNAIRPMSMEEISKYNQIIIKYSAEVPMKRVQEARKNHPQKSRQKAPYIAGAAMKKPMLVDRVIEQKYGKVWANKGPKSKIYVKQETLETADHVEVRKTRYTMPGPLKAGGMRDAGDYSIDKLSQYMLSAGQEYLENVFQTWSKLEEKARIAAQKKDFQAADAYRSQIKPVTISLKGHSRGAVATSHGAMMINHWIHKNYQQFEKYVDFELIQHDPVPGYFSDKGTKHRINIRKNETPEDEKKLEKLGMRPLGDRAQTTVVYSMHTQYPMFFSPQNVKGAKRIIFVPENHAVNLDAIDQSQEKHHRNGYTDASTGEVYRNSGLSELPEGVYIADEKQRMVRVTDPEIGRNILNEVTKSTWLQRSRHRRLGKAIDNWFSDAKEREIQNAKQEKKQSREKINFQKLTLNESSMKKTKADSLHFPKETEKTKAQERKSMSVPYKK